MALYIRISCGYYCNNCIYNCERMGQIPVFKTYNMTARSGIIYAGIIKYVNLLFSSKHKKLFSKKSPKKP